MPLRRWHYTSERIFCGPVSHFTGRTMILKVILMAVAGRKFYFHFLIHTKSPPTHRTFHRLHRTYCFPPPSAPVDDPRPPLLPLLLLLPPLDEPQSLHAGQPVRYIPLRGGERVRQPSVVVGGSALQVVQEQPGEQERVRVAVQVGEKGRGTRSRRG